MSASTALPLDGPRDGAASPQSAPPPSAVATAGGAASLAAWPLSAWGLALVLGVSGWAAQVAGVQPQWMLRLHAHPVLPEALWASLTLLGFGWAVLIVASALDRRDGRLALSALLSLLVGAVLVQGLKRLAPVPRPALALGEEHLSLIGEAVKYSGSMPSGHATAAAVLGTLVVLALAERGALTLGRLGTVVGLAAAVAWSRVAVGAHWPADVLVGAGLGIAVALVSATLATRWLRPPTTAYGRSQRLWWLCALELAAAAVCFGTDTGQPAAWLAQCALGSVGLASCVLRLRAWARQGRA